MNLGKAIVNELLSRLKTKADFVTVYGRINNTTKPQLLYKIGFYYSFVQSSIFSPGILENSLILFVTTVRFLAKP